MLSTFSADAIVRTRLAKTHLKKYLFLSVHVPPWQDTTAQRRVAELCARLTCLPATSSRPWADYSELAAAVGLTPARDGLLDTQARTEAEIELNALVAELYGLGRSEFRFLMDLLFMTKKYRDAHAGFRDAIEGRIGRSKPIKSPGTQGNGVPGPRNDEAGMDVRATNPMDPFSELGDSWSRPWKIARLLEKLGMEVPDRLRRERVAALVAHSGQRDHPDRPNVIAWKGS